MGKKYFKTFQEHNVPSKAVSTIMASFDYAKLYSTARQLSTVSIKLIYRNKNLCDLLPLFRNLYKMNLVLSVQLPLDNCLHHKTTVTTNTMWKHC